LLQVRRSEQRRTAAAKTIQGWFRQRLAEKRRTEAETVAARKQRAAALVFKVLTGWADRKVFLAKRNAAVAIQVNGN
jgi:hypothetical protein